jgi:phage baseplate assembly protein W
MASYNIKFPLEDNISKNNFFQMTKVTKEALASNLMLLLLTEKGERYYMPDYGTNLLKHIFEPKDNLTIMDVKEDLKKTVSTYIPQLEINDIEFKQDTDDDGNPIGENELSVIIRFTYSEDTFVDNGEIEIKF